MKKNTLDPFSEFLIKQHPRAIFLNRELDIYFLHGDFADILSLPTSVIRLNLEKMLKQNEVLVFADGVHAALETQGKVAHKNVKFNKNDNPVNLDIFFKKVDIDQINQAIVMASLSEEKPLENIQELDYHTSGKSDRIERMEKIIIQQKHQIRKLKREENIRITKLNLSNEELMYSNEELQSTNEELQSLNEELHTVNTEMQYKNKELKIANDDINNLLRSTDIGTIFLDKKLNIRKFTKAIRLQFDLLRSDMGRPISAFASKLTDIKLVKHCKDVLKTLQPFRKLVHDHAQREYLMRITPYQSQAKATEGVVITFVDISKTKTFLQEFDRSITETSHKFNAIFNHYSAPLLFLEKDGTITSVNRSFEQYQVEDLIGNNFFKLFDDTENASVKRIFQQVIDNFKFYSTSLKFYEDSSSELEHYRLDLIPVPDTEDETQVGQVAIIAKKDTLEFNQLRDLESLKATYTGFMDNAQHQMLLLDKEGTIIYINKADKSPYAREELIGMKVYQLLPPSEVAQYKKSIEDIFAGKSRSKISFKYKYENGEVAEVSVIASPVIIGEEVAYVSLIGDPLES